MATVSPKIIWAVQGICDYCGISRAMFYRLIKTRRFPATIIEGKWCAHSDNLDDYFKIGTKTPPQKIEIEAE